MDVKFVNFPETKVAKIAYAGKPENERGTIMKLVQWKLQHKLLDQSRYRTYGLHYLPENGLPETADTPIPYRVDFCLSIEDDVAPNEFEISQGTIPACRCAVARDIGSRMDNQAAKFLVQEWLPNSGEALSGAPLIFHYVNVGPDVKESEAITDVYLPLL